MKNKTIAANFSTAFKIFSSFFKRDDFFFLHEKEILNFTLVSCTNSSKNQHGFKKCSFQEYNSLTDLLFQCSEVCSRLDSQLPASIQREDIEEFILQHDREPIDILLSQYKNGLHYKTRKNQRCEDVLSDLRLYYFLRIRLVSEIIFFLKSSGSFFKP